MAPGGSPLNEVVESNSTGMDYDVKMAKVEVNNNKPTKSGSSGIGKYGMHSNNGVYELLECPVCTNLMYPPIHQCPNGHTLCSNCKVRVQNTCPTCRYELGNIRCLALEKVAESLEVPCRYQNLGCHDIFPYYSKLKHEQHCRFRPYTCPYAGSECSVTGDIPTLVVHLKDDHKVDMHGRLTKFWTDNWSGLGSIASYLASETCHALGIHRRSLIADLNQDGEWNIQPARSEKQVTIQIELSKINLNQSEDSHFWELNGKESNTYSTGLMYDNLRMRGSLVPWVAQIWFSGQIPRHSFLTWLFMRDRCPTRDRLLSWGINTNPLCLLCNSSPESRNHLFFACNFSFSVWGTVCSRLLLHPYRSWDQTNLQLQSLSGTANQKLLPHLAWQATIYTLWLERNSRLHHRLSSAPYAVFLKIDKVIRHRALSFKSNNPRRTSTILNRWFLP